MPEKITIEGKHARFCNGSGEDLVVGIDQFSQDIAENTIQGLFPEPMADNEKWRVPCGRASISVVELKPELRWIKWLAPDSPAPYGSKATYVERELATPYVVLVVPFNNNRVLPRVEAFYRNAPLESPDDPGGELYWPNLLNVSPNAYGCTAWFCTQYLKRTSIKPSITAGLNAVIHHLFGGTFNASSEAHEGNSTWSQCVTDKVDPRVTDVERWQDESRKDPNFVLSVKWKPAGVTVRNVVESAMRALRVAPAPDSAEALGNLLLRKRKPR